MKKILPLLSVVLLATFPAFAGGPFIVNSDGVAATWDNSSAIALHPEGGTCADFTNPQMVALIEDNMEHWSGIDGIELSFSVVDGVIDEDVDVDNYTDYYVDSSDDPGLVDSINPVIFDDDGDIVAELFGTANRFTVLGFAGPDGFADGTFEEIVDGQAFFNCRCLEGNSNGSCASGAIEFTEDDLSFTMVHEIGHMIGFDHSQVNQEIADETDCDLDVLNDCDDIPTMFPQSVDAGDQITPTRDDEVVALTLYGDSTWEDDTCTVTGTLLDSSGDPLRCADVQAISTDPADTIAVVSGAFAPAEDNDGDGYTQSAGECLGDCGDFVLRGLDPAKTYTITVRPIDGDWVGGSSISPCGDTQLTGVVEEEIDTITGCTAGTTTSLGTISTLSTGGITEGEADEDAATTVSCALAKDGNVSWSLVFLAFAGLTGMGLGRRFVHAKS